MNNKSGIFYFLGSFTIVAILVHLLFNKQGKTKTNDKNDLDEHRLFSYLKEVEEQHGVEYFAQR